MRHLKITGLILSLLLLSSPSYSDFYFSNSGGAASTVDATARAASTANTAAISTLNNDNATQAELDAVAALINGKVDQTVYDAFVAGNATDAEVEIIRAALQANIDAIPVVVVDTIMSDTSDKPLENKVIKADKDAQDALIAANTLKQHDAVTLGTGNNAALAITGQELTLTLPTAPTIDTAIADSPNTVTNKAVFDGLALKVDRTDIATSVEVDTGTNATKLINTVEFKRKIDELKITGDYIGSSAVYSTLPTSSTAGKTAVNGDWAYLSADVVGTGTALVPQYKKGVYLTDGTTYTFAFAIGSDAGTLTDVQAFDKTDTTVGLVAGGKQLHDAFIENHKLTYLEGTTANRPVASEANKNFIYKDTDTNSKSISTGTAWEAITNIVLYDTEAIAITKNIAEHQVVIIGTGEAESTWYKHSSGVAIFDPADTANFTKFSQKDRFNHTLTWPTDNKPIVDRTIHAKDDKTLDLTDVQAVEGHNYYVEIAPTKSVTAGSNVLTNSGTNNQLYHLESTGTAGEVRLIGNTGGDGLRGAPVANEAALAGIVPKDFELRQTKDNKKEWRFEEGKTAGTLDIAHTNPAGAWVTNTPVATNTYTGLQKVKEWTNSAVATQIPTTIFNYVTDLDFTSADMIRIHMHDENLSGEMYFHDMYPKKSLSSWYWGYSGNTQHLQIVMPDLTSKTIGIRRGGTRATFLASIETFSFAENGFVVPTGTEARSSISLTANAGAVNITTGTAGFSGTSQRVSVEVPANQQLSTVTVSNGATAGISDARTGAIELAIPAGTTGTVDLTVTFEAETAVYVDLPLNGSRGTTVNQAQWNVHPLGLGDLTSIGGQLVVVSQSGSNVFTGRYELPLIGDFEHHGGTATDGNINALRIKTSGTSGDMYLAFGFGGGSGTSVLKRIRYYKP